MYNTSQIGGTISQTDYTFSETYVCLQSQRVYDLSFPFDERSTKNCIPETPDKTYLLTLTNWSLGKYAPITLWILNPRLLETHINGSIFQSQKRLRVCRTKLYSLQRAMVLVASWLCI